MSKTNPRNAVPHAPTSRSERLQRFVAGRKKGFVATEILRIEPSFLSFLLRTDIDALIARIDALPIEEVTETSNVA